MKYNDMPFRGEDYEIVEMTYILYYTAFQRCPTIFDIETMGRCGLSDRSSRVLAWAIDNYTLI